MKFPPKMPIILADVHNLAVTSFYQAQRSDPKFENYTNDSAKEVLHGVLNTLLSATGPKRLGSCIIAGAWDGEENWRFGVDSEYKGGKKAGSSLNPKYRLGAQMHRLGDQLADFGILCERMPGLEADDTICLMARHPELKGRPKVLLTRDRDALAYVDDETFFFNPKDKKLVTPRNYAQYVAKAFELSEGLQPNEIPFFRALAGDSSDKIPGVTNFGKGQSGYSLQLVKALRDLGSPLTGPDQEPQEIMDFLKAHKDDLPKATQHITEDSALEQFQHAFNLVSIKSVPEELARPVFEPLEARFPERPSKDRLFEMFDKLGFAHFRRQAEEYGWGLGVTTPDKPAVEIDR